VVASGFAWVGTRTEHFGEMHAFLTTALGLTPTLEREQFAVFDLPSGDRIELFGPAMQDNGHFVTGPVVELTVADVDQARAGLEAHGVPFLAPTGHGSTGTKWAHFTAPDGHVWGLWSGPPRAG
jgi:hypothetical protein